MGNVEGRTIQICRPKLVMVEYATVKFRKFWQAEERQRVNNMRLQEHLYCTCIYEIIEHRKATPETATKLRYYQRKMG